MSNMRMTTRQIAGSATQTATSVALIEMRRAGMIVALALAMRVLTAGTSTQEVDWELSFVNTNQFAMNDALGMIHHATQRHSMIVYGTPPADDRQFIGTGENIWVPGLAIPVQAGDRVYLHCGGMVGATLANATYILYIME